MDAAFAEVMPTAWTIPDPKLKPSLYQGFCVIFSVLVFSGVAVTEATVLRHREEEGSCREGIETDGSYTGSELSASERRPSSRPVNELKLAVSSRRSE